MMKSVLLVAVVLAVSTFVYATDPSLVSKAKTSMLNEIIKNIQERNEPERNEDLEDEKLMIEKFVNTFPKRNVKERGEDKEEGNSFVEELVDSVQERNEAEREEDKEEENPFLEELVDSVQERNEAESDEEDKPTMEKSVNGLRERNEAEREEDVEEVKKHMKYEPGHPIIYHHGAHYAYNIHHAPMYWPVGTYGLLMPKEQCIARSIGHHPHTACPMGHWATGQRYHDTNDHVNYNSITPHSCLKGRFVSSGIMWNFCMQQDPAGPHRPQWPRGSYCIFKKGSCPYGFHSGAIKFDDEDNHNANTKSGVLPDGYYNTDTKYDFCCRKDGSISTPIVLPIDIPFYLLASTPQCQTVHGMSVREEMIFFDCENHRNNNYRTGLTPYDFGHRHNHKFRLCYYQHY